MENLSLQKRIQGIVNELGTSGAVIVKTFLIGNTVSIGAAIIYLNGFVDKSIIDRDILNPLMFKVEENIQRKGNVAAYLCNKYIPMSNTGIEEDTNKVIINIKRGKTAIILDNVNEFIICDTSGGEYRAVTEPVSETSIKGTREGFVENLETNISLLRRRIRDKNLVIEKMTVGRRAQADLALMYISDLADEEVINEIKKRIEAIDIDIVTGVGTIEQCIEDKAYSVFPQMHTTERPDKVSTELTEGRVVILLQGTPFVICAPAVFVEFFQAVEDYQQRTLLADFNRILRVIAVIIIISLPASYLTLIRYNAELIPVKLLTPLVESRRGIAFTPLMEILSMEIIVEILREGGIRLPTKIAQTLSVVGGFVIGEAAISAKFVSPATLIVVGVAVVSTFIIPNYDMSTSVRLLTYPMIFLANSLGALGIAIGWYFIILHLVSLDSFGVPYMPINKPKDYKDVFFRVPIWKMKNRPEAIPVKDAARQTDFRKKFGSEGNEKGRKQ